MLLHQDIIVYRPFQKHVGILLHLRPAQADIPEGKCIRILPGVIVHPGKNKIRFTAAENSHIRYSVNL